MQVSQAFEVPMDELSAEAIDGVVDAFVMREGTDYREQKTTYEHKRQQVIAQLLDGQVAIMFDPETTTCSLVPRDTSPASSRCNQAQHGDSRECNDGPRTTRVASRRRASEREDPQREAAVPTKRSSIG
jgi:uncharacterized protein YheU (UPF0270 family)